jgi:hypothetical protein
MDDFFARMDAELAKAKEASGLKAKKAAIQQQIRKTNPDRVTRILLAGEIKAINDKIDEAAWTTVASVALFQEQHCTSCGSKHRIFLQYMAKQQTTAGPKVTRFRRVSKDHVGIIHEVMANVSTSPICADCAEEFGFDLDEAKIARLSDVGESLAVAVGYEAEEQDYVEE